MMEKETPDLLLNLSQAAQGLGLCYAQVRRMIQGGQLPSLTVRGKRWVALNEVLKLQPRAIDSLIITISQAARLLGVLTADVRALTRQGSLNTIQISKHQRYMLSDVLALRKNGKTGD
jgi:hypothetical protein